MLNYQRVSLFFYLHSFATSKNHQKPSWNLSEGRFLGECVKHRTQHFAAVFNGSNPRKIHIEGLFFMEHPAAQLHAPKLEISFYSMCTYICTKKNIGLQTNTSYILVVWNIWIICPFHIWDNHPN